MPLRKKAKTISQSIVGAEHRSALAHEQEGSSLGTEPFFVPWANAQKNGSVPLKKSDFSQVVFWGDYLEVITWIAK